MAAGKLSVEELAALRAIEIDGEITPKAIVEAAREPAHPLHHRFTWSDTEAGAKWREQQARIIIGLAVNVTHHTISLQAPLTPVYAHDPSSGSQSYRRVDTIAKDDPVKAREIMAYTLATARGHIVRCEALASAFGLQAEIGDIVIRLQTLEAALDAATPPVVQH